MTSINSKDYIDELLYSVKHKDSVKTKVLLQHFDKVDYTTQRRLVFEMCRSVEENFVMPFLASLLHNSKTSDELFQNLRLSLISKFIEKPELLLSLINDPNIEDKRVFVEIAGEICCEQAIPVLISLLRAESNSGRIITIINSLGEIASSESSNVITEYLYSRERKIVISAIKALRKINSPIAIQRLAERMGADIQIDLLIVDIFAEIQDKTAIEKLNETLVSHYAMLRNYGKSKLVQLGSKAVPVLINNLLYDDPDLLIHTLNALGEIGDDSAVTSIKKLLYNEPKDPNVRFAAYEALGMLPLEKGSYVLAAGLNDPVDSVCAAAAKAINKNYNDVLAAGMKNIIKDADQDLQRIVRIVMDSEADNIFLDLLDNELAAKDIVTYLKTDAHKEVKKHFEALLRKKGFSDIANKISASASVDLPSDALRVCVIDDSRMILSVYRTVLHRLGYISELFEFPASAIEHINKSKPYLVLTDLNMPEITGIGVITELRKKYSKEELPIIMVTTQNEIQDNESAYSAGVNFVMQKPFDDVSLGNAIKKVLEKKL